MLEELALSASQQQMWLAEQVAGDPSVYTESGCLRLRGRLDAAALECAWRAVVARHEALRTVIVTAGGEPRMGIADTAPAGAFLVADLAGSGGEAERLIEGAGRRFVESPVDLAAGPLVRALLLRVADDDHALVIAMHHLVCDATAAGVVVAEIAAAYGAAVRGEPLAAPPPELQYADVAIWERELLATPAGRGHERYWTEKLRGAPAVLELPPRGPRPPVKGTRGHRTRRDLGPGTAALVRDAGYRAGASAYAVSLAAFAALVSLYTARRRLLVGTLVANRALPELECVVGQFSATVPLLIESDGDPSLTELARHAASQVTEASEHAQVGLGRIVELAAPRRDPSRNALLQHLFLPKQEPFAGVRFPGLDVTTVELPRGRGRFDTIWEVGFAAGSATAWLEYDTELFTEPAIQRILADYALVLRTWAADPGLPLSGLRAAVAGQVAVQDAPAPHDPQALDPRAPDPQLLEPQALDSQALDSQELGGQAAGGHRDHLLAVITELWAEVLAVPAARPDDDFFALGGHSMLASRLTAQLEEALGVRVPLRTLFQYATPAALAAQIRQTYPEIDELIQAIAALPDGDWTAPASTLQEPARQDPAGRAAAGDAGAAAAREDASSGDGVLLPLFRSQLQLWLMEQLRPGSRTHTIPMVISVRGPLQPDALCAALQDLVDRHEALRATFEEAGGEPRQRLRDSLVLDIARADLTGYPPADRAARAAALRDECAYGVFDLATGPLLRAGLARTGPDEHLLLLLFHHLVTDEVSMTVFARDLSELYLARVEGRRPALPELTVGLAAMAAGEHELLTGPRGDRLREFWAGDLAGVAELDLPVDHPRPSELTVTGEFLMERYDRALFDGMAELARRRRLTPFTVFLAAVAVVLRKLSGNGGEGGSGGAEIIVGVPSENRVRPGAEHLMGCFLNVLPLRVGVGDDTRFDDLLAAVRDRLVAAYEHQALPIADIIDMVRPARSPGRLPLVQVTCELQLDTWLPLRLKDCDCAVELLSHGTARYELAFHGQAYPDFLMIALELNTDLWLRESGHSLINAVATVLGIVTRDPAARIADLTAALDDAAFTSRLDAGRNGGS